MKTIAGAFAFLLGVIGCSAFLCAQANQHEENETLSFDDAVLIMRAINTAEAESIALSKHAINMQAVREHRFVKKLNSQISLENQSGLDRVSVKGYEVRLLLTQDQLHWTLTISPLQGSECTPVFMTNETGVIYHGVPASCKQNAQSASN
jgi:hypothetical protein